MMLSLAGTPDRGATSHRLRRNATRLFGISNFLEKRSSKTFVAGALCSTIAAFVLTPTCHGILRPPTISHACENGVFYSLFIEVVRVLALTPRRMALTPRCLIASYLCRSHIPVAQSSKVRSCANDLSSSRASHGLRGEAAMVFHDDINLVYVTSANGATLRGALYCSSTCRAIGRFTRIERPGYFPASTHCSGSRRLGAFALVPHRPRAFTVHM